MSLDAFEKPSNAYEFFKKLTSDSNPGEAIKRLVNAIPPVFETEWLDFKGAAKIDDAIVQKTWSKVLAGFANTQGGVLIWGIDARPDSATGVDVACGVSLVSNPDAFKSRLNQLHDQATEPPVLGVEIESYPIDESKGEGFVVCYVPESPFKPHRAERADRQYIIRAGDDFVTAGVSILRHLFFPQSRCFLVPTLKARCSNTNGFVECFISGFLKNTGSATAFDTFIITHYEPRGGTYSLDLSDWQTGPTLYPYHSRAKTPIHPGIKRHFFEIGYVLTSLTSDPNFRIHIFAQDAEPAEWLFSLSKNELELGIEKEGVRKSLFFKNNLT